MLLEVGEKSSRVGVKGFRGGTAYHRTAYHNNVLRHKWCGIAALRSS